MNCLKGMIAALLICHGMMGHADEHTYAIAGIPDSLKKDANSVIRDAHMEMDIVSESEIYVTQTYAITILNEKGVGDGVIKEEHDQFIEVKKITGTLYNSRGEAIQDLKKNGLIDISAYNSNFVDDVHFKIFDFGYRDYPYTCEYTIETRYHYSMHLPSWSPEMSFHCAVEHADLEVIYPAGFSLRSRAFHLGMMPEITATKGGSKLTASIDRQKAVSSPDYFTPIENRYLPTVIFAADKFSLDNRRGNMATWNDFGQFVYQLNEGRDELNAASKEIVKHLTDTCRSDAGKIKALYEYLKQNTRYLSIQLGIGSWQTFDAQFVADKAYGDCKALSNYMKALLKVAGITAYQALVTAGVNDQRPMIADFPNSMFNHVILCVPGNKDTTWIECTAKNLPAGYLSDFTDNRNVLLLTPDGGFMVRTPHIDAAKNKMVRKASITMGPGGEMTGKLALDLSGIFWERENEHVTDQPKSKVDNYLNSKFKLGSYEIGSYTITNNMGGTVPRLAEVVPIKGGGNSSVSGEHLFLSPRVFSLGITPPASFEPRRTPFQLHRSFEVADTIIYDLPGNYTIETKKDVNVDNEFASYHYTSEIDKEGKLKVLISFLQKEGVYSADQYQDYIKLYKQIITDDANKLVLVKAKQK